MAKIKFSVSDARLQAGREIVAAATLYRIRDDLQSDPSDYAEGMITITRFGNVYSSEFELRLGTWQISITTPFEDRIHRQVRVSFEDDLLTLQLGNSEITTSIGHGANQEDQETLPFQLMQNPGTYARRLSPSRGLQDEATRRQSSQADTNSAKVNITVHKYAPDIVFGSAKEFSTEALFAEKMDFWCRSWGRKTVFQNTKLYRAVKDKKRRGINICNFNLHIPAIAGNPIDPLAKFSIQIDFSDQTYTVILPLPVFTPRSSFQIIDIELKFLNDDYIGTSDRDRLVSVRLITNDAKFDSITQFLASGDLPSAITIWRSIAQELLFHKLTSPISAAAASLVLAQAFYATQVTEGRDEWYRWVENLSTLFPSISDSRIVNAWLSAIAESLSVEEKNIIASKFAQAITHGVPIFTESIRLLCRGAEWAFKNDENNESEYNNRSNLAAVRWLASRVIAGNALTSIRHERD